MGRGGAGKVVGGSLNLIRRNTNLNAECCNIVIVSVELELTCSRDLCGEFFSNLNKDYLLWQPRNCCLNLCETSLFCFSFSISLL